MMIGRGALLLAVTASLLQVVSAVRSKKLEGAVASQRQQQQKQLAPAAAVALGAKEEFLSPEDGVAVTFWIISISMVAATVFFLMESMAVKSHWKTSMNVGALVTLVAAVHYFYMREYWVKVHESPILYRYIDWSVTVPLQMIEFYLILAAVKKVGQGMFWRLLLGTVAMLTFGYLGEAGYVNVWLGFALGMAGWFFILYEIFAGEAGQMANSGAVTESVKSSFNTMRLIVTAGWSIYPLGYVCGYLMTGPDTVTYLNLLYNVADFVNKIGFCVSVWACAKAEK
jgi:bacteriorhodopsin